MCLVACTSDIITLSWLLGEVTDLLCTAFLSAHPPHHQARRHRRPVSSATEAPVRCRLELRHLLRNLHMIYQTTIQMGSGSNVVRGRQAAAAMAPCGGTIPSYNPRGGVRGKQRLAQPERSGLRVRVSDSSGGRCTVVPAARTTRLVAYVALLPVVRLSYSCPTGRARPDPTRHGTISPDN